jgi:hypothetical protein
MRKWIGVGFLSAATLIGGGIWAHAQVQVPPSPRLAQPAPVQPPPQIISGADIGFRVDSIAQDGTPVGRIVVHQKGQWVEVMVSGSLRRLTAN